MIFHDKKKTLIRKVANNADWIHPARSFTLGIPGPVGPYGEKGCECCGLYLKDPSIDVMCEDCETLCIGEPWCPYYHD